MEITLTPGDGSQIDVACDGQPSHTFDLNDLNNLNVLGRPAEAGATLYRALFPDGAPTAEALAGDDHVLLIAEDAGLQAIPWEYAHGPNGFLVLDYDFVRGLPEDKRIAPPTLGDGLHVVAVPSNPLDKNVAPLNVEGEWWRLCQVIQDVPARVTLERARPPTLERLRDLVAGKQDRVVHFTGHGGRAEDGEAVLCFEDAGGGLCLATAHDFTRRVHGRVFLVVLSACVSATPGPTEFSNLAAALVARGVPYALGMRFEIFESDALIFSRVLYSELARGSPVEEAVRQARVTLAGESWYPWAPGYLVLYTSLREPASLSKQDGAPKIRDPHPSMEVNSALPRAKGTFRGRVEELRDLGGRLTGDARPKLVTVHGGGGQGKTALAREAVERFAHAWPGGVWAVSLENLPSRAVAAGELARFLGVDTGSIADPAEIERQMRARLRERTRVLVVLDNAETLVQAVDAENVAARDLADLLRGLPGDAVSLLATSRRLLGWPGEVAVELGGLADDEGARLFMDNAPARAGDIRRADAEPLSAQVGGHPLSLRLLGGAFNQTAMPLAAFVVEYEAQLAQAEDKYRDESHRHRTLYACIDTSVRHLAPELRDLLSLLWIFEAPFLPETAAEIFDPDCPEGEHSPVQDQLGALWARGLLERQEATLRDGRVTMYHLLPVVRPYMRDHLRSLFGPSNRFQNEFEMTHFVGIFTHTLCRKRFFDELRTFFKQFLKCVKQVLFESTDPLARFGEAYAELTDYINREKDHSARAIYIAQQARADLDRSLEYVTDKTHGYYLLHWSSVLGQLGDNRRAMEMAEGALAVAREDKYRRLELEALVTLGRIYITTGQPARALELYEQILPVMREIDDRRGEAVIFTDIATIYRTTGQPARALELYEQALPVMREIDDRRGEAVIFTDIATIYRTTGQLARALELYEQALPIICELGDRASEAVALNGMALVYQTTGQPARALELCESALSIMRELGDRQGKAVILSNMALVYSATGQPARALELYESALSIMREVGDRAGEANALNGMALVYQTTGQSARALELCEQALPIRREVDDRVGEISTLLWLAEIHQRTGKPREALKIQEQVLPIMREVGDRVGEAATLNNMGKVYYATGQPARALELYEQALPIVREVGNRQGKAVILGNMALVYSATGQPARALELYEQALSIMREVSDRAGEATTLNNMANVYYATGQLARALELCEQALPIMREVDDRVGEAITLNDMANVYSAMGQLARALKLYECALPIMREVGDRAGEATTFNNMANVYSAMGQPARALELCEQALPIRREVGDRAGEAITLNDMALAYRATGQPARALELYERALPIRREVGDRAGEAATVYNMSFLVDIARAIEMVQHARDIWRAIQSPNVQTAEQRLAKLSREN